MTEVKRLVCTVSKVVIEHTVCSVAVYVVLWYFLKQRDAVCIMKISHLQITINYFFQLLFLTITEDIQMQCRRNMGTDVPQFHINNTSSY